MYAPIVIQNILNKGGINSHQLLKHKDNKELRDLLVLYNNPYIKHLDTFYFEPKKEHKLKIEKHNEFMNVFWNAVYHRISTESIIKFLYSCDIHSQAIYYKILTGTLTLNVNKNIIDNVFPNRFPTFDVVKKKKHTFGRTSKLINIVKDNDNFYVWFKNKMFYDEVLLKLKKIPVNSFYIHIEKTKNDYFIKIFSTTYTNSNLETSLNIARYKKFFGNKIKEIRS